MLTIQPLAEGGGWEGSWSQDGRPLGDPFRVGGEDAKGVRALSRSFLELFEQGKRPSTGPEALRALGRGLYNTWFRGAWGEVPTPPPGSHVLVISSPDRHVLNLPWELVELHPDLPLGCDAGWAVLRTPLDRLASPAGALPPGPLRVLFLAADPTDQRHRLDFEREEDAMLRATTALGERVILHVAETGGFEELEELVSACRPHVVHLSGHGRVRDDGTAVFAFEDEEGRTDSREASELVTLFRGSGVRCVFLNGCQTSQAAEVAGFAQALIAGGVPLVLGWGASVADDLATEFTAAFYKRIARGEPLATAGAHARAAIWRKKRPRSGRQELQDATFALAQLYASGTEDGLFDASAPAEPYQGPRTEYFNLGDGIKGLREGFVGRRRQVQRVLPALRRGDRTMLVLTGIGGAGKSTLATRIANRLATDGFRVLPVRAAEGESATERARATLDKILAALSDAFTTENRDGLRRRLADGNLEPAQRARLAAQGMNEVRLALVLDNFEDCLHLETRGIADPELATFYRTVADQLTRGSRVLVTCRYLPAGTPERETLLHEDLTDLEPHDRRKLLRRDERVEARIASGELGADLLDMLFRQVGGTPGFLAIARSVLRTVDLDELEQELTGDTEGRLTQERAEYLQRIFAQRLYNALSPEARTLVSRLALCELPLPNDAAAEIAELDGPATDRALAEGVEYGLLQRLPAPDGSVLHHPPGLLRPWLTQPELLAESEARAVHAGFVGFWKVAFETDRNLGLGIPLQPLLEACRHHARLAPEPVAFRWATVQLGSSLHQMGEWKGALSLLEEVPNADRDAECLLALALTEGSLGEWVQARTHLEAALPLPGVDRNLQGSIWHNLASIDMWEGNYAAAREKLGRALQMWQAVDNRVGEAAVWHQLGSIDLETGDCVAAREKLDRSLSLKQALGDAAGEAMTMHQLASIDLQEEHYMAAREKLGRSLSIKQALRDRAGEAMAWHQLASIDLQKGDYTAAQEKLRLSLSIKQVLGDRAGEAATWHNLASIDLRKGKHRAAQEKYNRSLSIKQAIGDQAGEAITWQELGYIAFSTGKQTLAVRLSGLGWAILRSIGHTRATMSAQNFATACAQAGLNTQDEIQSLIEEVMAEYQRDRGAGLLARAFGEEDDAGGE